MQRYSKNNKAKVIFTLFSVVLLISLFAFSTFAIAPPDSFDQSAIVFDSRLSSDSVASIVQMTRQMDDLGYFVGSHAFIIGYYSSTTNSVQLYCSADNLNVVIGTDGSFSFNGGVVTYRLTEYGWKLNSYTSSVSLPSSDTVAYRLSATTDIQINNSFTNGSWVLTSTLQSTIQQWDSFYNSVVNYDVNLENRYNQGVVAGQQVGYGNGYTAGYEAGYDEGYDAGLAESPDYQTGYEIGYADGRDYTYPIAYQEGYQAGLAAGGGAGGDGDTVIVEELDIGSIISSLPESAKSIINGALGFEIFGINVAGTLTAILVVAIVGFVVKWLLSLKS